MIRLHNTFQGIDCERKSCIVWSSTYHVSSTTLFLFAVVLVFKGLVFDSVNDELLKVVFNVDFDTVGEVLLTLSFLRSTFFFVETIIRSAFALRAIFRHISVSLRIARSNCFVLGGSTTPLRGCDFSVFRESISVVAPLVLVDLPFGPKVHGAREGFVPEGHILGVVE